MNNMKVFLLMAALTALLGALGSAFGGQTGLILALVFAGGMNFFAYFASSASRPVQGFSASPRASRRKCSSSAR